MRNRESIRSGAKHVRVEKGAEGKNSLSQINNLSMLFTMDY